MQPIYQPGLDIQQTIKEKMHMPIEKRVTAWLIMWT